MGERTRKRWWARRSRAEGWAIFQPYRTPANVERELRGVGYTLSPGDLAPIVAISKHYKDLVLKALNAEPQRRRDTEKAKFPILFRDGESGE